MNRDTEGNSETSLEYLLEQEPLATGQEPSADIERLAADIEKLAADERKPSETESVASSSEQGSSIDDQKVAVTQKANSSGNSEYSHPAPGASPDENKGELPVPIGNIVLAHIQSINEQGQAVVTFIAGKETYQFPAMATCPINSDCVNRQVALSFIDGRVDKPLILGVVYSPLFEYLENVEILPSTSSGVPQSTDAKDISTSPVLVDGKKVTIEGSESVELRCGDASITLTKDGKIVIRGKYLLNRSSGVNRIIGGSVQVN